MFFSGVNTQKSGPYPSPLMMATAHPSRLATRACRRQPHAIPTPPVARNSQHEHREPTHQFASHALPRERWARARHPHNPLVRHPSFPPIAMTRPVPAFLLLLFTSFASA